MTQHKGSCLCGAVTFQVEGPLPEPDACHCIECRKQSGHFLVSTDVPRERVSILGENALVWYKSSDRARRGFCATCGSNLFFDPFDHDWIAISMGAFDGKTETQIHIHIFVAEKGDYYQLADGIPRADRFPAPKG